jgi:hypothetical protein
MVLGRLWSVCARILGLSLLEIFSVAATVLDTHGEDGSDQRAPHGGD